MAAVSGSSELLDKPFESHTGELIIVRNRSIVRIAVSSDYGSQEVPTLCNRGLALVCAGVM
jgi:hypothetical protein